MTIVMASEGWNMRVVRDTKENFEMISRMVLVFIVVAMVIGRNRCGSRASKWVEVEDAFALCRKVVHQAIF